MRRLVLSWANQPHPRFSLYVVSEFKGTCYRVPFLFDGLCMRIDYASTLTLAFHSSHLQVQWLLLKSLHLKISDFVSGLRCLTY
jgi:hypothetical protein